MLEPEDVRARLSKRFQQDYPKWATGRGSWPWRFGLRPPSTEQRAKHTVDCHAWAANWACYDGPGEVEYATLQFPTGKHSMPKTLVLHGPDEVAAAEHEPAQTWQLATSRLVELLDTFPTADPHKHIRRITELSQHDYDRLCYAATWLRTNPTSGMLLRQLPIEGIDTKWLQGHGSLVLALLGTNDDCEYDTSDLEQAAREHTDSRSRQLHQRLGLRPVPELVHVAVLDPRLRSGLGGMRHFAAAVEDLNSWPVRPRTVVILENQETGYAFTADVADVVVLHGMGANVASYARIDWVHSADVIYWGDIDGPGLRFVAELRTRGVSVRTALMDLATLRQFRHLAVRGASPGVEPDSLTDTERALYRHLADYAADNNAGLLLEQERIPWPHAQQTLAKELRSS